MLGNPLVFLLTLVPAWKQAASYAETSTASFCRAPPQPENGYYIFSHISKEPEPGLANEIILRVTCDPGYELVGEEEVSCLSGHWFDEMPKCARSSYDNEESEKKCISETELRSKQLDDDNSCGIEPEAELKIIAGGRPSEGRELPWHAAIYTKATKPYMQICGGTLVSKKAVISAAHCFWPEESQGLMPADNFAVGLQKKYRPWADKNDDAQKFNVTDIKVPPRYQGSTANFQDDIAILILSAEVMEHELLNPVCLSFDPYFDADQVKSGSVGKTGGWGLTSEDGKASPILQIAQLPFIDVETCIAELPSTFKPFITSDKICAGHTNGTAVCKGDSGGGLVVQNGRRYFLRGVISTAPVGDHACNVYTWATFTHIQRHELFIRQHVDFQEGKRHEEKSDFIDFINAKL